MPDIETYIHNYKVRPTKLIEQPICFDPTLFPMSLYLKGGRADLPPFETIKTNAGTQPKNELQQ